MTYQVNTVSFLPFSAHSMENQRLCSGSQSQLNENRADSWNSNSFNSMSNTAFPMLILLPSLISSVVSAQQVGHLVRTHLIGRIGDLGGAIATVCSHALMSCVEKARKADTNASATKNDGLSHLPQESTPNAQHDSSTNDPLSKHSSYQVLLSAAMLSLTPIDSTTPQYYSQLSSSNSISRSTSMLSTNSIPEKPSCTLMELSFARESLPMLTSVVESDEESESLLKSRKRDIEDKHVENFGLTG